MTIVTTRPYVKPVYPAVPYPRFGVGVLPSNPTNADYLTLLNNTMTKSISGSTFSMNDAGSGYMYFASPNDHGNVRFVDTSNNIEGGWDGASWPTDGTVLESVGKVDISLTVGDDTRTWYLYRTDFAGLGTKTWKMLFDEVPINQEQPTDPDPGTGYGDVETALANVIPITVNGPTYDTVFQNDKYLAFSYVPSQGEEHTHTAVGTGDSRVLLLDSAEQIMLNWIDADNGPNGQDEIDIKFMSSGTKAFMIVHNETSGEGTTDFSVQVTSAPAFVPSNGQADETSAIGSAATINVNSTYDTVITSGNYAAFRFDALDGRYHEFEVLAKDGGDQDAQFTVWQAGSIIQGPINADNGPGGRDEINTGITIDHQLSEPIPSHDDVYLVVHNADTGTGTENFTVRVIVDLTPPPPMFGVGNIPQGFDSTQALSVLTSVTPAPEDNMSINLTTSNNEYMYYASPVDHGDVLFTDTSNNYVGGWDGASWPSDGGVGTENGPVIMELNVDGDVRDWYIYRSDFPSLGSKTYRLSFSNA